jgi:isopentenyldiphosphate isomerase
MTFLDRIEECNTHDLSRFAAFTVAGLRVGWVRHALLGIFAEFADVFVVEHGALALHPRLRDAEARSSALAPVLGTLAARGVFAGWRDELYPVSTTFSQPPLLLIERAAVPLFGVRAYGVHMNGFVRRSDGLHMWVARRSVTKPTYPGQLDNTVAGGQPVGIGLLDNLVKECREEAGIPEAIARRAQPVGVITYCMEAPEGLLPDAQFCFDLELPADFVPTNRDGEVAEFQLWPIARVVEVVRDSAQFKFNCNLVLIDFFIRHGILLPDDPDYIEIAQGLTR